MAAEQDPPRSPGSEEPWESGAGDSESAGGSSSVSARESDDASAASRHEGTVSRREGRRDRGGNMLPGRERRRFGVERLLVRLVATCGIVGIGVAIAAIMVSSKSQGWVVGLVVAIVTVVLS
ncbi:MAG TPA: hypothetical protein VF781_08995, partial [Solirubrobacteraceae bacterium]